ncbi:MAG TPA: class I SAM-dependent methyltransferase, partial [Solirubrobacteraceae bacterium]|nr:class I SAM-dependent methyltransferase [Solirubrobacteraceae bacterium]
IASIGMVEHVGANKIDAYAAKLAGLLGPGGRLLNHGIARLRHGDPEAGAFSERYVFPDAAPLHVSRVLLALERAGIEPTRVEGFRQDYVDTLSEWIARLDANLAEAERLAGGERVRVWRLYLRAARNGFAAGFTSIFQILGTRPPTAR